MSNEQSKTGRIVAIIGVWLQLGLVVGLLWTVVGMMRAFNQLSTEGEVDPAHLADDISTAFYSTGIGLSFCVVGLFLIGLAMFAFRYQPDWLFNFLFGYSFVLLFVFPIGTIIGILILIFCWTKRKGARRPELIASEHFPDA